MMYFERGADMYAYWNVTTYWVVPRDFLMGVGKSVFFGVIVTLIGAALAWILVRSRLPGRAALDFLSFASIGIR